MATVTTRTPLKDSDGLILPKKLLNPCHESRSVKDLHREIKWNKKAGINVLESKSELEKAMAKQRLAAEQKQKEAEVALKENEDSNPEFKRVLAERAKRLERLEAEDCGDAEEGEDEVQPKAKEVFQRLEGRMEEGVRAGKKSLPTRGNEVVVGNKKVENSSSPEEQSEFAKVENSSSPE